MDLQQIKELALLMQQTGLTSLHLTEGAVNIQMERAGTAAAVCAQPIQTECPQPPQEAAKPQENPKPQEEGRKVLSPMVGVFYSAPSPQSKPFVEVGSRVKKGDVLALIGPSGCGKSTFLRSLNLLEICGASGDVVEYGQTLFRIQ